MHEKQSYFIMDSKWRGTKIGHGVKIPKSKNMVGIKTDSKSIQENIKKLRTNQRKKILQLRKNLKEFEHHVIAISGLETLSNSSIKRIQNKRETSTINMIQLISELSVLNRQIKKLETEYRKSRK